MMMCGRSYTRIYIRVSVSVVSYFEREREMRY